MLFWISDDTINTNIFYIVIYFTQFCIFYFSSKLSGVLCFTYAIMALENTQGGKKNVEVMVSIMYNTSWLASFLIGFAWRRFIKSTLFTYNMSSNFFFICITLFLEIVSLLAEVRLHTSTLLDSPWLKHHAPSFPLYAS